MMYGQAGQQGQDPGMYYGGQGQGNMGGYGQQYNMGGARDSSPPRPPWPHALRLRFACGRACARACVRACVVLSLPSYRERSVPRAAQAWA